MTFSALSRSPVEGDFTEPGTQAVSENLMKIAYVTTYDSCDVAKWSGLGYYIFKTLELAGFEVHRTGKLKMGLAWPFRGRELFHRKFLSTQYAWDRAPYVLRHFARQVEKALARMDHDVVFSPGTLPIAELQTTKPIVFWADATFDGMVGFYSDGASTCVRSLLDGHTAEQKALSRCRLAIYASDWAARSAIQHYDVDAMKIKVVPFGANMECSRTAAEVAAMVESRRFDQCRLLFCGTDWDRKGGALALEVAETLNDTGLETELHIVGCRPPQPVPSFVKVHGFVSKRTPQGRELLDQLFMDSHFLIVPSKAECFGVVFSEASSFGVPSLSRDVGGIPTAIRNDCNGRLFPVDAGAPEYADYIRALFRSKDEYVRLALSSFAEYQDRLSWPAASRTVGRLIREFCT